MTKKAIDELTYKIIGCAIEVHKELGPGLLESVYEKCLIQELMFQNLKVKSQLAVPLHYKGIDIACELRLDVLVEDCIVVELKAVDFLLPVFSAQLLTYLKLLEKPKGILINFNCTNIFKEGQKTFVNEIYANLNDE
ncbi:MAG TPA: GxxExxY protein [Bacteroidales bacterium]|nr:GxxExxY protein [Bacteroidales bacterium]